MEVRKLEMADSPVVRRRAGELAALMYPELIEDVDRTHTLLAELRQNSAHYAYVIGPHGHPRAALLASTGDNVWATRRHATILLWYSDIPGAGAVLMRNFRHWVLQHKQIAVAGLIADCMINVRALDLMERLGFQRRGRGAWVLFPRGAKR
jgi:hypothetical protein